MRYGKCFAASGLLAALLIIFSCGGSSGENSGGEDDSASIPRNGLVGEWLFSGNANDTSGNGLHGTVNGATLVADRDGNPSCAYSFDGSNDYIEVADNALLDITDELTICAWVKFTINARGGIVSKWNGGWGSNDPQAYDLFTNGTSIGSSINGTGGTDNTNVSTTSLNDGNWHFVVVTVQSSLDTNEQKHYIDGSLDAEFDTTEDIIRVSDSNLYFGYESPSESQAAFNGCIDDVRIYNRALSADEISLLYNE